MLCLGAPPATPSPLPPAPPRPADGATPSASAVWSNVDAAAAFPEADGGPKNLHEMFAASVATHGPRPCLGARTLLPDGEAGPYEWQTYAEVGARVDAVGTALARARVGAGGRVGVYGVNSPEWMITMQV